MVIGLTDGVVPKCPLFRHCGERASAMKQSHSEYALAIEFASLRSQ
jgi:hypothetical protein